MQSWVGQKIIFKILKLKSKFSTTLFANWISEISHVLSFFSIWKQWMVSFRRTYCYWLSITYYIACVSFLSIFFFFLRFFVSSITCWDMEVSLTILKRKQWSWFLVPKGNLKGWVARASSTNQCKWLGSTNWTRFSLGKNLVISYLQLHLRNTYCRVLLWN